MATKKTSAKSGKTAKSATLEPKISVVNFSYGMQTYQIDPERHKVYRRFVEIETGRASTIFASWRASTA